MDPVTHAVAARMAASLGRPALSRRAALLAVIGGLAPDIDAVMMPVGWDLYLRVHEAGTHSIPGGLLLSAVLAGISCRVTAAPWRQVWSIAAIAIGVHIFLDVISGATIKLAWPFAHARTAAGLVAMADPLLAIPIGLALLVMLVTRWQARQVTPLVFTIVGIMLAVKLTSRQLAVAEFRTIADGTAVARYVHAQWGTLTQWWIYERTPERVRLWNVDSWTHAVSLVLDREVAPLPQLVAGEQQLSTVSNFLRAHDLPVRVRTSSERSTAVFWSDLRFCFAPDPRGGPPPGSRLRPTTAAIACGVWFGGEIGRDGRILRQFVTIGDFVQER